MKILKEGFSIEHFFDSIQKNSLLMMDYDGTLAPFVTTRTQAIPYPKITKYLEVSKHIKNMRIVIISGRGLYDLEKLLSPISMDLELWGSHGLERKLCNGERSTLSLNPLTFEGLEKGIQLSRTLIAPSQYEIKPFSIAIHWRGFPPTQIASMIVHLKPLWEELCQFYPLELHYFDGGLELRPKNCSKAFAVQTLLREAPSDTTIAYFGDDVTDEEAFQALANRGLKVLVREKSRSSLADIQLIPPHELLFFLEQWREKYASKR